MSDQQQSPKITVIKQIQQLKVFSNTKGTIFCAENQEELKQCSFKLISLVSLADVNECHFLRNFSAQMPTSESTISEEQMASERNSLTQKLKDSPIERNNIFKNIVQSFIKFIGSSKDKYTSQALNKIPNLKNIENSIKVIKRKLKQKECKWNKKILSLLKSDQHKLLFRYFLEHIEELWLGESKVEQKENTLWYVKYLIKAIDDPVLREQIKYYKKN